MLPTSIPFVPDVPKVFGLPAAKVKLFIFAVPETFKVPVAVMFAAVKLPLKYPFPFTSSLFEGEVVPMPTFVPLSYMRLLANAEPFHFDR